MRKKTKQNNPVILVEEYSVSREIAELQLNRLRDIARERFLTYEEAKVYDLLTKNLLLSKGEATTIVDNSPQQITANEQEELLKLAQFSNTEKISDILNVIEEAKDGSNQDPNN